MDNTVQRISSVINAFCNETIEKKRISIVFKALLGNREQLNKELYYYNLSLFAPEKIAILTALTLQNGDDWRQVLSCFTVPLLTVGQKLGYTIPQIQNDITQINSDFCDWL